MQCTLLKEAHALRDAPRRYETANSDRLGFDTIYPPNVQTTGGDEPKATELLERYDAHLQVATELYNNMSLTGSRRTTTNCGSKAANPALKQPRNSGTGKVGVSTFHAAAFAAASKAAAAKPGPASKR